MDDSRGSFGWDVDDGVVVAINDGPSHHHREVM